MYGGLFFFVSCCRTLNALIFYFTDQSVTMSVIEENWDFRFDIQKIEKESYNDVQSKINKVHNRVVKLLEDGFKTKRCILVNDDAAQNHDHELRSLTETNKQLQHSIDAKLEEIGRQHNQYESYKQGLFVLLEYQLCYSAH